MCYIYLSLKLLDIKFFSMSVCLDNGKKKSQFQRQDASSNWHLEKCILIKRSCQFNLYIEVADSVAFLPEPFGAVMIVVLQLQPHLDSTVVEVDGSIDLNKCLNKV